MKGKMILPLMLLFFLTACSSGEIKTELSTEITAQNELSPEQATTRALMENETDNPENLTQDETGNPEALVSALGFPVLLPGFDWIKNVVYSQPGEGSLQIDYYDESLGGDCVLTVGRESALDHTDCTFDESAEETWVGDTASGQTIYIKVQHSTDGRVVAAEWEYLDYRFVLCANVLNDFADTNMVPKTVRSVIGNFGL